MSALKNIESWIERTLTSVIDFFYPPFRKVMSLELFRYAACGGLNLALDWTLFYFLYHFVFHGQVFDLGFIAFTPHIAALSHQLFRPKTLYRGASHLADNIVCHHLHPLRDIQLFDE